MLKGHLARPIYHQGLRVDPVSWALYSCTDKKGVQGPSYWGSSLRVIPGIILSNYDPVKMWKNQDFNQACVHRHDVSKAPVLL